MTSIFTRSMPTLQVDNREGTFMSINRNRSLVHWGSGKIVFKRKKKSQVVQMSLCDSTTLLSTLLGYVEDLLYGIKAVLLISFCQSLLL